MTYDFGNYKGDRVSKPRNAAWGNWAKFEKVGDKAQGFIRDVFFRPAEGIYKEARCFTLEQADGTLTNVRTKRDPAFLLLETDNFHIGDPVTFELTELKPTSKGNPAKIIEVFGKKLPENTGKTVKELESEDMVGQKVSTDTDMDFPENGKPQV
jgi:hypothetical protein